MIILGKNEYSEKEIQIAKELWSDGMYYLARDKDQNLFAYSTPVNKSLGMWVIDDEWRFYDGGQMQQQNSWFFGTIRFRDTEPTYIGDILEYPLPIDENRYIREVIKLFNREDIKGIFKAYTNGQLCLTIYGEKSFPYAIISIEDDQFKNMDINYEYKLEELGI